ncbi:YbjC family protein [Salmonella enterica]
MRTIGVLPKSVLILEYLGMILLALALLSLNHYLTLPAPFNTLPAPFNTPLAGVLMVFLGVVLILPAAVAMMWRIAQLLAPQLMKRPPDIPSRSDREKHNESDH